MGCIDYDKGIETVLTEIENYIEKIPKGEIRNEMITLMYMLAEKFILKAGK